MLQKGKEYWEEIILPNFWQSFSHFNNSEIKVLDVGSFDVNGNIRDLIESSNYQYTGLDIVDGPNVDVVAPSEYSFPFPDNYFDLVASSYCMEHVKNLQKWINECVRVLKHKGMIAIITHHNYKFHPHPVDCWRMMPDGFKYLFDENGSLHKYQIDMYSETDIAGIAIKKGE